jgi:elongation factor 3
MPALDIMNTPSSGTAVISENTKSVKVLDELLGKLTVSKSQDETNAAATDLASFINGTIEEHEAPTK